MSLLSDAISTTPESLNKVTRFSRGKLINSNTLQEIVQDGDLDENEIVSIIFLFTDKNTDIAQTIQFLENTSPLNLSILTDRINWQEKFLESLIIIGNVNVIKKLGFNNNEVKAMKERFVYNEHNISENLNRVIKSLYFVSNNLLRNEVEKLIAKVNGPKLDKYKLLLELYILYWIQQKYISINEEDPNLDNIIKDLKNVGLVMPFNLEYWQKFSKNEKDSSYTLRYDNSLLFTSTNSSNQNKDYDEKSRIPWQGKSKRLCIIINVINFKEKQDDKYEQRSSSIEDEEILVKTFKGCDFEVPKPYRDLTTSQMIRLLNTINEKKKYSEYSCIFMCILSHGSEGEIVFSDAEKIKIKIIENEFCCQNLQNVFKLIILQSCQGKNKGYVNKKSVKKQQNVVTDGASCALRHMHFGLFQATINGYAAFRHIEKGSWFIQDICKELRTSTPIMVTEWEKKVKERVTNRRCADSTYSDRDLVQIPKFSSTITVDYEIPKYQELLN